MRYSRNVSTVSSGSHEPVASNAFCPASTSFHAIVLPCFAAAASMTSCAAGQMSTPVPSPSTKGMIGSSGTESTPLFIVILSAMGDKLPNPVCTTRYERTLRTGALLEALDRLDVLLHELEHHVADGTHVVHPADDLADGREREVGPTRAHDAGVGLRRKDVLQRHAERTGAVGRVPRVGPRVAHHARGLAGVAARAHGVGRGRVEVRLEHRRA